MSNRIKNIASNRKAYFEYSIEDMGNKEQEKIEVSEKEG